MSKKRFFLAAVLAAGIGLTTTAYQAPPLLLVEDEDGVVEQPAQTISAKESNPADQRKTAKSAPAPSTAQGGLVLIDEEENTQVQDDRKAEETRLEQERIEAEKRAEEVRLTAEKKAKAEADKKAKEEAVRIEKARQDSIKAAQEEAKRIEKARQDSIKAAKAEAIRIEKMRQDSIRAARQDSIQKAQEAERIRIEQARQDSIRAAQEAAVREQARQDSIRAAQEAAIREQARLDSIRVAQEAAIREQARQDSIRAAQETAIREKTRQDSIHNAEREGDEKQTNAAVQVYVAPAASAPAQNMQSDDLNSKMLEALQRAYEEALKQANKSDSIRLVQWQLEQELKKLKEQQAALEAQKQKEQEEKEAAEQAAALAAQAAAQQQAANAQPEKETVFTRYYKHSGRNMLSILSIGYSTYFQVGSAVAAGASPTGDAFRRHLLNVELFEWRAKCFGMQMFNFEMGLNTPFVSEENPEQNRYLFERGGENADERVEATAKTMWFAYKPAVKFYIPCTKWLAIELYGGAEVDLTKMWSKINSTYYTGYHNETNQDGLRIPEQNSFVGVYGGAGFMLTAVPQVPLEIKAEYRHPVKGNTALVPQGVYISAQLHLASPIKK